MLKVYALLIAADDMHLIYITMRYINSTKSPSNQWILILCLTCIRAIDLHVLS